ncbi:Uncharacterised protein [Chlamydia abortus]|nr:Uncharacterised protein [Chlamydia abortus]
MLVLMQLKLVRELETFQLLLEIIFVKKVTILLMSFVAMELDENYMKIHLFQMTEFQIVDQLLKMVW